MYKRQGLRRRVGRDAGAIARARSASVFGALPLAWLSRWGFSLDEVSAAPVGADAAEAAAAAAGEPWAPAFGADGGEGEAVGAALDPAGGAMVRAVDTGEAQRGRADRGVHGRGP